MMQSYPPIPEMKLIGIISHQGTKDNGHYTAITKKGEEWTLYNGATTTHITTSHMHQTQAYILMYRKTSKIFINKRRLARTSLAQKEETERLTLPK